MQSEDSYHDAHVIKLLNDTCASHQLISLQSHLLYCQKTAIMVISQRTNQMNLRMRPNKNITFQFTVEIVILVNICDFLETSDPIIVLQNLCL